MLIVIAPNTFRDCLEASEVAVAIQKGLQRYLPSAEYVVMPLSDGGDGVLEVFKTFSFEECQVDVINALGNSISAKFLISQDRQTAIVEMAEASGLKRITLKERNPWVSSTYGTGEILVAALESGVKEIIIGAGGSATIDGGAGALCALGARFLDEQQQSFIPTPKNLLSLKSVDLSGLHPRLSQVKLTVISDVDTPLSQNLRVFGEQKGVLPELIPKYEKALKKLNQFVVNQEVDFLEEPWLGAGGGTSGGMVAFLNAKVKSGSEFILELTRLTEIIRNANLVITAEGKLDESSLGGKLPCKISEISSKHRCPCIIIAGKISFGIRQHLPPTTSAFSISLGTEEGGQDFERASQIITEFSEQIGKIYSSYPF